MMLQGETKYFFYYSLEDMLTSPAYQRQGWKQITDKEHQNFISAGTGLFQIRMAAFNLPKLI